MNKLDKFIDENCPTKEEIDIYRKVKLLYAAEDLKNVLDDMLEEEQISEHDYEKISNDFERVIKKYEDWNDADWYVILREVIQSFKRSKLL